MHFALKFSPLCNITRPKEELLPNQKSPCGKSLSAFAARRNYNILFVEENDLVLVSALKNGVNELEQSALLVVRYQLLFFSSESSEDVLIELSPARIDLGQRIVLYSIVGSRSHGLCQSDAREDRHCVAVLPIGDLDYLAVEIPVVYNCGAVLAEDIPARKLDEIARGDLDIHRKIALEDKRDSEAVVAFLVSDI